MISDSKLHEITKVQVRLAETTRDRESLRYIDLMAELIRHVMAFNESECLNILFDEILDSSGHCIYIEFKGVKNLFRIDTIFIVELPNWLRVKVYNSYVTVLKAIPSEQRKGHPSLEHQRLFSELKKVLALDSYPNLYNTNIHQIINDCLKNLQTKANHIFRLSFANDALSSDERAARKLAKYTDLMKGPARVYFRIKYLELEIQDPNPTELKIFLERGYYQGCLNSISHYLKEAKKTMIKSVSEIEEQMKLLLHNEVSFDSQFPGNLSINNNSDFKQLIAISKGWDQLKFKKFNEIKNNFDSENMRNLFNNLNSDYESNKIVQEQYIAHLQLIFKANAKKIKESISIEGWVHRSLDLDQKTRKTSKQERDQEEGWIWDNATKLTNLNEEVFESLEKVRDKVDSSISSRIFEIFCNVSTKKNSTLLFDLNTFSKEVNIIHQLIDDTEEDSNSLNPLNLLIQQYILLLEKYSNIEEEDTSCYGKLIIKYPNREDREDYLLKLFSIIREYKKLEESARNLIIMHYHNNMSTLTLTDLEYYQLCQIIERSIIFDILALNFKSISSKIYRSKFNFITSEKPEDAERQRVLLLKALDSIPPNDSLTKFLGSLPTEKSLEPFDLLENYELLTELRKEILRGMNINSCVQRKIFEATDNMDYWHVSLSEILKEIKNTFVNISEFADGKTLAQKYRDLKEHILKAQRYSSAPNPIRSWELYQTELVRSKINKDTFFKEMAANVQALQNLLTQANQSLLNLKYYQRALGDTEDFSYLDQVLSHKNIDEALKQFSLLDNVSYENLQHFAVAHTHRNRLMKNIFLRASEEPEAFPEELKKVITEAVILRFLEKNKISPEIKLKILTSSDTHLEAEIRYLILLANFCNPNNFRSIETVKMIFKIFERAGMLSAVKPLRKLIGSLRRNFKTYKPKSLVENFNGNSQQFFTEINDKIKDKLDYD